MISRYTHLCTAIVFLLAMAVSVAAGGPKVTAEWSTEMYTDGFTRDWDGIAMTYFEDEQVSLGMANDSGRLYVLLRTGRQDVARLIRMTGLTLYFDSNGKQKKDFKLFYRGGPDLKPPRGQDADFGGGRGMGGMRPEPPPEQFRCYQKDRIIEKDIPTDGTEGPAVGLDTTQGLYAYEFSVPLGESGVRYYGMGAEPGARITVGLIWGDMSDMPRPGGMGGGRGGGMGGGPPGGMGGGMGRGGGGRGGKGGGRMGGMKMPEKQEIWIKTNLATIDSAE